MNLNLKALRLIAAAALVLLGTTNGVATGNSFATGDLSEPVAGSTFAVSSVLNGSGNVVLADSREWENEIKLSVGLDYDGSVRVNGAVVGSHNPGEASQVEVASQDGVASVVVRRASCGSVICNAPNAANVVGANKASAAGAAVTLDVSQ